MKYSITIESIETVQFKDKEYEQTGKKENGEPKYEYVYFDSEKEETRVILKQEVDDLDLPAVIKAINNI